MVDQIQPYFINIMAGHLSILQSRPAVESATWTARGLLPTEPELTQAGASEDVINLLAFEG